MVKAGALDAQTVQEAVRLGWALAEARGRLRRGPQPGEAPIIGAGARRGHALPLARERSWLEQTLETERVLSHLAGRFQVDFPLRELSGQAGQTQTSSERMIELARAAHHARSAPAPRAQHAADEVDEFFYVWDARIQDELSVEPFPVSSGYQLGRALADTYWALGADASDNVDEWPALLGKERIKIVSELLSRLSGYLLPLTPLVIAASLTAWGEVAKRPELSGKQPTQTALHDQARIWHDLLLARQPPESLIEHRGFARRARRIGPVLSAFLPEVTLAIISMLAAIAAVVLFLAKGHSHAWAGVLALFGAFGITSSSALAKAKSEAHDLLAQLRLGFNIDLIKHDATLPPARKYIDPQLHRLGVPSAE